jgi:hypothetical protein
MTMMGPLGIKKSGCKEISGLGAGGPCKYFRSPEFITTEVMGKSVRLTAMFGPTERALLGRSDFFKVFKVSFDQRKKRFRLEPY